MVRTRFPSAFTLFDRLMAFGDLLAALFRGRPAAPRLAVRLGLEPVEARLVPTAAVWVGPLTQAVPEGSAGGVWVYRSGDTR
ncbi:MAG TPA: hypothetical protein VH092_33625, partial [Urbifossiella sp.]|nr:hypothetical protein [Urbifossiella sp.]